MVEYECKKCKKKFDQKSNFDKHTDRKTDCSKIKYEIKKEKKNNVCDKCNREFSRECSLKRHMNICKANKVIKTKVIGDNNNLHNYNDCTINNTIKIENLVVFGKEGIEHITVKDLIAILNSKTGLIESLVEKTNLDPSKPQYHNVFIKDLKSGYGDIYGEKGWKKKNINAILNTIIDTKSENINEILENYGDSFNDKIKERLKNAVQSKDYKNMESRKLMKKYLKEVLFNGSKIINKSIAE